MQSRNHRSNSVSECIQSHSNNNRSLKQTGALYSSPGPANNNYNIKNQSSNDVNSESPLLSLDRTFTSSPIIAFHTNTFSSGTSSLPGTPVDIRSVPQVRQLSCKKLVYSYTFGDFKSNLDESATLESQNHSHNNHDSCNRSPTSNCRQSYHKNASSLLSNFIPSQKRNRRNESSSSSNNRSRNDSRRNERPTSLSSRFSSMAAERLSSATRNSSASTPSRGVSKASGNHRRRERNNRGMEVDQIGNGNGSEQNRNRSRNNSRNRNINKTNNKNDRKPRNPRPLKKAPLNQSDLDKDLEAYMMKNESVARNTLDMELDSYMASAPSKTN